MIIKSSITIDTKRYRETSLVCCLWYYYSCCALVIIRGNQLVIFPGIALYYGNTSIIAINNKADYRLRLFSWGANFVIFVVSLQVVKFPPTNFSTHVMGASAQLNRHEK